MIQNNKDQLSRHIMHPLMQEYLEEADVSSSTLQTYRVYLSYFSAYLAEQRIHPKELSKVQLRRWLQDKPWSANTRRIAHCAVRSFLRCTYGKRHAALRLPVKAVDPGPQRTLSAFQIELLINSQDASRPVGLRNIALVTLMLDTGLRAAEVCRLVVEKVNLEQCVLSVVVKGGKWGYGAFSRETADWISVWLEARKEVAKPGVHTLFVAIWGYHPGSTLTRDGLRGIFRRMGKKAGLGLISPHDIRRTFATLMIENHAPTRIVQIAGRWKNIREVERYTRKLDACKAIPYLPVPLLQIQAPIIGSKDMVSGEAANLQARDEP